MKIAKRIVVALVLCLAVVGAYALLKKAPQLNVSTEDIHYLQEVGISASESATDEGLSGAHGSVEGAPPLVLPPQIQGSNTPPCSFGIPSSSFSSPAPLLPAAGSETPALTATVLTTTTEAPPFAVNSEAPPFVPANPATVTASPFVIPNSVQPAPPPSVPPQTIPNQPIPVQPVPVQTIPLPPPPPIQTPIPPPVQSHPPDKPVSWDGPITEVVFIPSTENSDSWRVSGVTEHPAEPSESLKPLESLPKPVDPFLASVVSAPAVAPAITPVVVPVSPPFTKPEPLISAGQGTVSPDNNNNSWVKDGNVAVSGSRIKRLPVVTEEPQEIKQTVAVPVDSAKNTTLFTNPVPTNSPKRLYSQTSPLPEEKYPPFKPNDYRQTSIHTDVVFAPVPPLGKGNEERPMISFVPQKPEKTEKTAAKEILPVTSTFPIEPERATATIKPKTEKPVTDAGGTVGEAVTEAGAVDTIPFIAVESSPAVSAGEVLEQRAVPMIRETVERFIKAQTVLIESGEAAKIRNAFVQLSRLYEHQELNAAEKVYMKPLLDRLALNVIYARNAHILEPPYIIRLGDSIDSIAQTFDLSPALLMKINGLTGARPLEPGTELKVIAGHFDAKISAEHRELTLILGGLYAGRFPIALGERIEHLRGEFYVSSKTDTWNEKSLMLNNGVVLYGTDRPQPGDPLATTVRFTQQDAKELFDILTEHSVIVFED